MAICPTCFTAYSDDEKRCSADGATLVPDDAIPKQALELEEGRAVGEYRIERKIGEGGFGAVYAALHPVIGKSAAIKVLSPQFSHNPTMVSRFIAEARAVNQIRHRGIIDIFAFGKLDDGRQYYIMELLEGLTLEAYLRQHGRLRPAEALPILRQIARALDAAHAAGIAHRDLKPENVFIVFDDDRTVFPKLLDFGIAKLLGDSQSHKTRTGTPMGTPLYMSPEQCRGKQVDHRTDIYSFGVMTHIVLTGHPPFEGEDVMDVLMQQVQAQPPSMSSVCPDLSPALDAPVLRMLAKDPAERPASVGAAVDALIEAARGAGIEVPSVATRSSENLPRVEMPRTLTPEQAVFAQADTLVQTESTARTGEPKTLPTTTSDTAPLGARRGNKFVGLAVGAGIFVAGVVATLLVVSHQGGSAVETPVTAASAQAALSGQAASAEIAPAQAPPPKVEPAVTPMPQAQDVELKLKTTPEAIDVYLDDHKLGSTPQPIKVPRGDKPVELTFSASGYQTKKIPFTPNQNGSLDVTLDKDKPSTSTKSTTKTSKTGTGKSSGELEF